MSVGANLTPLAGNNIVLRMYPSCKLVRGRKYSAIYDFDRKRLLRFETTYYPLFELSTRPDGLALRDLDQLGETARKRCTEALGLLHAHEIVHESDGEMATQLAPVSDQFDIPSELINCIIDVRDREHNWAEIITRLSAFQCQGLQIRCFSGLMNLERVENVLGLLSGTTIWNVQLLVRWGEDWAAVDWVALLDRYRNVLRVRIHGSPEPRELNGDTHPRLMDKQVSYETKQIAGPQCCGSIVAGSLTAPTSGLYSELRHFNGCLNRKVSIRSDGEICNCPSMAKGFGKDVGRLEKIIRSAEFQKAWALKKDDISVCKECEFRYVCTDCRAYLGSDLSLAKPARCSYDPDTGQWAALDGHRQGTAFADDVVFIDALSADS